MVHRGAWGAGGPPLPGPGPTPDDRHQIIPELRPTHTERQQVQRVRQIGEIFQHSPPEGPVGLSFPVLHNVIVAPHVFKYVEHGYGPRAHDIHETHRDEEKRRPPDGESWVGPIGPENPLSLQFVLQEFKEEEEVHEGDAQEGDEGIK